MTKIAAFIAAWKMKQQQTVDVDRPRNIAARRRAEYADYGDNGTEAEWLIVNVDNFR